MDENDKGRTVRAGANTYFLDIKNTKDGKRFLVITQSRFKGEGQEHERSSVVVFPEASKDFLKALNDSITQI
jgi:hypothetical protein